MIKTKIVLSLIYPSGAPEFIPVFSGFVLFDS